MPFSRITDSFVALMKALIHSAVGAALTILPFVPIDAAENTASAKPAAFVQALRTGKPQRIVFFGTSLTHGGAWVGQVTAVLQKEFPDLVTTFNGAMSGQTSRWGLSALQKNVIDQKPDVVFIEFSVNDAVDRFEIPLEESRKNLETIIDKILAANPRCQIILHVTNPVVDRPVGDKGARSKLEFYQQMYRDVGARRGLLVVDDMPVWQRVLDKGPAEYKKYVPDGLHPNAQGCELVITPTILSAIGVDTKK